MNAELVWMPHIDHTRCTGCGDCIAVCPTGALGLVKGRAVVVQPQACTYCAACEAFCLAIELPYEIGFSQNYQNTERH